jgi:DNA-binding response OmpR family regulator
MSAMVRPGRLLVVDDERAVRSSLQEILEQEGHQVTTAASGEEALLTLGHSNFDLILVDLKMEGIDGLQVTMEAKERAPDTVVIILTAYGTLDSAIRALRYGAHDYLLKPCEVEEIIASVEAGLAKRWQSIRQWELVSSIEDNVRQLKAETVLAETEREELSPSRFVKTQDLLLDREKQIVILKGEPLNLTPTEFKLLACLVNNMNRALSFGELAREVQGYDCSEHEARGALKTHLWRLRKKLKDRMGDTSCIVNIRGKGYMFVP